MGYVENFKNKSIYKQIKLKQNPAKAVGFFVFFVIITTLVIIAIFNGNKKTNNTNANSVSPSPEPSQSTQAYLHSVCLDAAHGGVDQGTSEKGILEKDVNLSVAKNVKALLEAQNYKVYITRTIDESLSKQDRYDFCNTNKAEIMASIHHNSYETNDVNHSKAVFYKNSDQALANSVANAVSKKLGTRNTGIASLNTRILSKANMPATIIEAFFISSSKEYNLLIKPGSTLLQEEAQGIVDGITDYFSNPNKNDIIIDSNPIILESDEN